MDGGDLSVTAGAANASAYGLQALIDDTVVLKAVDSTPADEQHYRARFYFHPNSLTMGANTSHYIFDGYDTYHGAFPFRLELFYESGSYKLRSRAMKDDWSYASSSNYTLSNAWHYVEIEWQASTAPGANNGFLSLWIDGTLMQTLSALDNDDIAGWLDEVRLGATNGLDATTSGSMLFDNFEARRNTYIGPVSSGPTHTPTPTVTASVTPTASKTSTPSQTPSATSTPTKTATPSITFTPSKTSTPSQTPSTTSTPTKTFTPSATPSATPTASNTPSPTPTSQGGPISITASFKYDGDGRRVSQTINGVTTYFVGNYYEVTGSIVTKYYYAGAQRVAMRANGTLYFLLGDHLGSTSLTTNDSGNVVSEMRYTPWGEMRYNTGTTQTEYGFTGQYSHEADFGLLYFNARWLDPSIGRFAQPDTMFPVGQGVQAWDKYAYANNNPLRYNDPTGHWLETAFDVAMILVDVGDIASNGLNWGNGAALAVDVASAILPGIPAMGGVILKTAKAANAVDNVLDTANVAVDAAKALDNAVDSTGVVGNMVGAICSFRADTQVTTKEGDKEISSIEVGDYVLAWNEDEGSIGFYEVTASFSHADEVLTELIIDGEWIETTPEHPFYVEEEGWTPAENLEIGDEIRRSDGTTGSIWLTWTVYHTQEMYNLTVDTAHTFFVGDGQWLVHNACGGRRGNAQTQAQLDEITEAWLNEHPDHTHVGGGRDLNTGVQIPEEYIPGPFGSRKGSSYPDLTFEDADGTRYRINTVDTNASGDITERELSAINRIFRQTGEFIVGIFKRR